MHKLLTKCIGSKNYRVQTRTKRKNVLRDAVNKALDGDDTKDSSDIQACKAAVKLLDSYFRNRDAFLD